MKKIKVILLFLIIFSGFTHSAYAKNIDEYYNDGLEASGATELSEYLSEETEEYLEKLGCEDIELQKILDLTPAAVFNLVLDILKSGVEQPLKGFMNASGTVLLVSMCSVFFSDNEKSKTALNLICGCVLLTGIFISAKDGIKAAASVLEACCVFEKALIPVLAGVVTACGTPSAALTYKGAAFAAAEFISAFSKNFAVPLVGISGALGITGSMIPTLRLSALSDVIRKTMTVTLASAASLFTGFLALKSVLSSSADGMITKGVKLASGAFIPVIGGAIGEAYSSVLGSLGLIKNTVGLYAVTAFFVICIPVIINLALWVLAMRGACALSELLDCRECSEILKNTAFVFSMLNTVLVLCMAVFIITTGLVIAIKTGE